MRSHSAVNWYCKETCEIRVLSHDLPLTLHTKQRDIPFLDQNTILNAVIMGQGWAGWLGSKKKDQKESSDRKKLSLIDSYKWKYAEYKNVSKRSLPPDEDYFLVLWPFFFFFKRDYLKLASWSQKYSCLKMYTTEYSHYFLFSDFFF